MIKENLFNKYIITACMIMTSFAHVAFSNTSDPQLKASINEDSVIASTQKAPSLPLEMKHNLEEVQSQVENKGYYEVDNDYASFLLNIEHDYSSKNLPDFINVNGENDFFKSPNKLKLANIKNFPSYIMQKNIIGSTPLGSWVKDKHGWSGYKIFFKQDHNLTCAFSYFNLRLSGGRVLPVENVKEYIKGKEASSEVKGSNQFGFVYSVSWFTPDEVKILDCAQSKFDKNQLERLKQYAALIENES